MNTSPYPADLFGGAKGTGGIGLQQAQGLRVSANLLFIICLLSYFHNLHACSIFFESSFRIFEDCI